MLIIPGYQIVSEIYQSIQIIIYKAIRESDQQPVILKTIRSEYPRIEQVIRLRQEYKITENLNIKGIVKALELKEFGSKFVLVLEYFNAISLQEIIISKFLPVKKTLAIGIKLASTLSELHNNYIIHKDIKPHNILINLETTQVKINDFGIASRHAKETQDISHSNQLSGTLAYMAPEQTGRMNRSIDYRSDFYSLGVTFYEMLTGELPFKTTDALELIHCHIAVQPVPPVEINSNIPQVLSDIVMKLMAKTPEDRYQSAEDLKVDLENCLNQLEKKGKIEDFFIAGEDLSNQLLIPPKLYGSQEQVEQLFDSFDRVASGEENRISGSQSFLLHESGLKTGNIDYVYQSNRHYCTLSLVGGLSLELVEERFSKYIELVSMFKKNSTLIELKIWDKFVFCLRGGATNKKKSIGETFKEEETLLYLQESHNYSLLAILYIAKTILMYLFKNYDGAVTNAALAKQHISSVGGMNYVSEHSFYQSLAILAQYPQTNYQLEIIEENQKKLQNWAFFAPHKFQHKYDLVEAEKARVLGQNEKAMDLYEKAIQGAINQGYLQEEALAGELAAEFHLALGRQKIAKTYMTDAYYAYMRWGAVAKLTDLDLRYPDLIYRTESPNLNLIQSSHPFSTIFNANTVNNSTNSKLDLATLIKAMQAISGEIKLDKLFASIIKILIENAGAKKGFLLLHKGKKMAIAAAASVDYESEKVVVRQSMRLELSQNLPLTVINYVLKNKSNLVLSNADQEERFANDSYIARNRSKSILCQPIFNQGKFMAILYLENDLIFGAFTVEKIKILNILSTQAAMALENALLYENLAAANRQLEDYSPKLEKRLEERTRELKAQEARLAEVERLAHLGNWEFDLTTDKITWSDELFRIFALHPEQIEPTYPEHQKLIHPDDWQMLNSAVEQAIQTGKDYEIEFRIVRPDAIRYVVAKGHAIKNDEGKTIKLFGILQDISDRKLAEQARRKSEMQLKKSP